MAQIEAPSPATERVLLCFSESPTAQMVIREAARIATALHAELYALYVEMPGAGTRRALEVSDQLARNQRLARDLGAQVETVHSYRVAEAILAFAHEHHVGQIVLGRSRRTRWQRLLSDDVVRRVVKGSGGVAVRVIGE